MFETRPPFRQHGRRDRQPRRRAGLSAQRDRRFPERLRLAPVADRRPLAPGRAEAPRQPRRGARPLARRARVLDRRMKLVGWAISLSVLSAVLICVGRRAAVRGEPHADPTSATDDRLAVYRRRWWRSRRLRDLPGRDPGRLARGAGPLRASPASGGRGPTSAAYRPDARHHRCHAHRRRPRALPLLRRRRPDRAVHRGRARRADHRLSQRLCRPPQGRFRRGDRRGAGERRIGCTRSAGARSATAGSSSPMSRIASGAASSSPGRIRCTSPPSN